MSANALAIDAVVSDPDVRGGRPSIAGTRICVSDLAAYHTAAGLTPDELAVQFGPDLGQVHAALAYYYQHKTELDLEVQHNSENAEHWRRILKDQGRLLG